MGPIESISVGGGGRNCNLDRGAGLSGNCTEGPAHRWGASGPALRLVCRLACLPQSLTGGRQSLDDRLGEGRDVVRLAAGDEVAIGNNLLVDPAGPGVDEVGVDGGPAGQGLAADNAGLDEG